VSNWTAPSVVLSWGADALGPSSRTPRLSGDGTRSRRGAVPSPFRSETWRPLIAALWAAPSQRSFGVPCIRMNAAQVARLS
jgi:hypothetical protein